ncbi:MAG: CoA ester lyase [Archangium sp.]|nr:CoA ester lyase [Archangium sp.]
MTRPIRRTELTCPGHSLAMMQKAAASDADEVIFDLEDACAVSKKIEARRTVAEALRTSTFTSGKVRAYRINGVETPWCYRDLVDVLEASGEFVDAVVVPKVRTADDVRFVDRLVTQIEQSRGLPVGRIRLEVLLETAAAVLNAQTIAMASPRLDSLIFGVADFAGEVGARDFREHHEATFAYARQHLLVAARAAGLDAIDSVTVQYKDLAVVERDARHAHRLGFDGKWAIHPAQVPVINQVFTPSDEELAQARRIVEAYAKADRDAGLGAIVIDDEMVDAATLTVERRKIAVAEKTRAPE